MIKNGKVESGKTPSELSGKKSDTIKKGSAVCRDEQAPDKRLEDLKIDIPEHEEDNNE